MTTLETVTALTAMQIGLCVVGLAFIFTLQYLSPEKFQLVGSYYQAVIGAEKTPTVEVGILGEEVDWDALWAAAERAVMGEAYLEKPQPQAVASPEGGMGGENPYIPQNLNQGRVLVSAKANYPAYGTVTSPFGLRQHPITGNMDFHTGIDIAAREGENIYAAFPGIVAETGISKIYGNYLRMDHGGGLETVYCHCSVVAAKEGQRLRAGARIGEIGDTGMATGPHLHFEVRVKGDYTDPMNLFAP